MKNKLTPVEYTFYILVNILTLGGVWVVKLIIKKAILEAK